MVAERRWERLAPATGIAAVVLWVIGVLIFEAGDRPGDDAAAREFSAYFEGETGKIFAGTFFFALGTALFLWFVGSVRAALAAGEGGAGRVSAIAFAAGIATAAMILAFVAPGVAGAIAADANDRELTPQAAEAFWHLGTGFFVMAEFTTALLLAATALVALRTRVLPAWLAWASIVLAIGLLVVPVGWAVLIFGFPLWILVVSGLLLQREQRGERMEAEPPPTPARV